jgi:hypothetical protein
VVVVDRSPLPHPDKPRIRKSRPKLASLLNALNLKEVIALEVIEDESIIKSSLFRI